MFTKGRQVQVVNGSAIGAAQVGHPWVIGHPLDTELLETGTDPVGQAREAATESLHHIRDWSSDLPERIAAALPVVATVPAKPKKRTLIGVFALGAAVAYFFDPASGAARRDAVKQRIAGIFRRNAKDETAPA